jgi:hypothetical protein
MNKTYLDIKNLENMLKRDNKDKIYPEIKEYKLESSDIIEENSLSLFNLPRDKNIFIQGGIKYLYKWTDILIQPSDYERVNKLLPKLKNIILFVRKAFNTDIFLKILKKELDTDKKLWWKTVAKNSWFFLNRIFGCTDNKNKNCIYNKFKEYPNSITSVTALPFFIGDCREHAFFLGFLLANYFMNNKKLGIQDVRIIYTRSYKVMDNKVDYLEDHVFPIIKKNNSWIVADSFYCKKTPDIIYYQDTIIKVIKKEELPTNAPQEMKEAKVVLRCGKIFRDNKIAGEIYNIPVYFTNNYKVIQKNIKSNEKLFYMFNRPVLIKDYYQDLKFPLWNFNSW